MNARPTKTAETRNVLCGWWLPLLLLMLVCSAQANEINTVDLSGAPIEIPDGSPVGLTSSQHIISSFNSIEHLSVTLNIVGGAGGGWNGDLYAYLFHDGVMVVLLNRPGVTSADPIGYGDSGLNITLDDSARNNIHNYQNSLPGTRFAGALSGIWAPDGRAADPDQVTDQTPVTTSLSRFNGLDPNGDWTLFLLDDDTGGLNELAGWSLTFEATSNVPDQWPTVALLFFAFISLLLVRSGFSGERRNFHPQPRLVRVRYTTGPTTRDIKAKGIPYTRLSMQVWECHRK